MSRLFTKELLPIKTIILNTIIYIYIYISIHVNKNILVHCRRLYREDQSVPVVTNIS